MPAPVLAGAAKFASLAPGSGFDPFSLLAGGPSFGSIPSLKGGDGGDATSVSGGTFVSGTFNPVFGSDATPEQQVIRSILPLVAVAAVVWIVARK